MLLGENKKKKKVKGNKKKRKHNDTKHFRQGPRYSLLLSSSSSKKKKNSKKLYAERERTWNFSFHWPARVCVCAFCAGHSLTHFFGHGTFIGPLSLYTFLLLFLEHVNNKSITFDKIFLNKREFDIIFLSVFEGYTHKVATALIYRVRHLETRDYIFCSDEEAHLKHFLLNVKTSIYSS